MDESWIKGRSEFIKKLPVHGLITEANLDYIPANYRAECKMLNRINKQITEVIFGAICVEVETAELTDTCEPRDGYNLFAINLSFNIKAKPNGDTNGK